MQLLSYPKNQGKQVSKIIDKTDVSGTAAQKNVCNYTNMCYYKHGYSERDETELQCYIEHEINGSDSAIHHKNLRDIDPYNGNGPDNIDSGQCGHFLVIMSLIVITVLMLINM